MHFTSQLKPPLAPNHCQMFSSDTANIAQRRQKEVIIRIIIKEMNKDRGKYRNKRGRNETPRGWEKGGIKAGRRGGHRDAAPGAGARCRVPGAGLPVWCVRRSAPPAAFPTFTFHLGAGAARIGRTGRGGGWLPTAGPCRGPGGAVPLLIHARPLPLPLPLPLPPAVAPRPPAAPRSRRQPRAARPGPAEPRPGPASRPPPRGEGAAAGAVQSPRRDCAGLWGGSLPSRRSFWCHLVSHVPPRTEVSPLSPGGTFG